MANGFPPFADMDQLQMLFEKERGTTPRLLDVSTLPDDDHSHTEQRTRRFSDAFHEFTDLCLKTNPDFRPSPNQLLTHPFFNQVKKIPTNARPTSPRSQTNSHHRRYFHQINRSDRLWTSAGSC